MRSIRRVLPVILSVLLFILTVTPLYAVGGDTTVTVFSNEPVDSPRRVAVSLLGLPDASETYSRITMTYTLTCPREGCDPWDRVAFVYIAENAPQAALDDFAYFLFDAPKTEIGRLVTPYGKGWTWEFDVTDYRHLLTDSAYIVSYVTTYIGKGQGYYLDVTLTYEQGDVDFRPYAVHNLWKGSPEYGNPNVPIEEFLHPVEIAADKGVGFARARMIVTGHGQGNTDRAGEFARKWHQLVVNGDTLGHYLWRDDCHLSLSGVQYGTWQEPRAGFCPGDVVIPWDSDISGFVRPGSSTVLNYDVEGYENLCRPDVAPCPCSNCEYDGLGHTKPHFLMDGHVVYYRVASVPSGRMFPKDAFQVESGGGRLTITPRFSQPTSLTVSVVDILGNVLYSQVMNGVRTSPLEIDLTHSPGVYLLKIESGTNLLRKRVDLR